MSTPSAVCLMHDMPHRAGNMVKIALRCRPKGTTSVLNCLAALCSPTPTCHCAHAASTHRQLSWHFWILCAFVR